MITGQGAISTQHDGDAQLYIKGRVRREWSGKLELENGDGKGK